MNVMFFQSLISILRSFSPNCLILKFAFLPNFGGCSMDFP